MFHSKQTICRLTRPPGQHRNGITLTEVLISVFVLGSGLLGLASLVPLGQYHVIQANNQDRGAACARWVFRQLEGQTSSSLDWTQSYLYPLTWVDYTGNQPYIASLVPPSTPGFPAPPRGAVILDPRFLGVPTNQTAAGGVFPFNATAAIGNWDLRRLSFADPQAGGVLRQVLADQLCIWRDDLLFAPPSNNENDRPSVVPSGANVAFDGEYSWLAMIRPAEQQSLQWVDEDRYDLSSHANSLGIQQTQFVVSVVVLRNRPAVIVANENAPSERQVQASFVAPGWFNLSNAGGPVGRISPNQWIMISGNEQSDPNLWFHRWYRVVNVVDNRDTAAQSVSVKVAGPDWPAGMLNANATYCTIIDGAVGVYERPMSQNMTFRNSTSN